MNLQQWRKFSSIMIYGKISERKEQMDNNLIAELLEQAERMLKEQLKSLDEQEADIMTYPNMQNLCLLMQTIAQLRRAYSLLALDQGLERLNNTLDGFRRNGFPVEQVGGR